MDEFAGESLVERLGYVVLRVENLQSAVEFYQDVAHLQVTERSERAAFLSGGAEHHWIRLEEGTPAGFVTIGYEVTSREALEEAQRRLKERGIEALPVDPLAESRINEGFQFTDPDGAAVQLFYKMVTLPQKPIDPVVRMRELLHVVWHVPDPLATARFYQEVFGFKVSDQIEDAVVFLRAHNRYHHSLGFGKGAPGAPPRLNHFCILVEDIDDVMRARNYARTRGLQMTHDVLRHAASGSVGTYIAEPNAGIDVEFCCWHETIDDKTHVSRILPAGLTTLDVWAQP